MQQEGTVQKRKFYTYNSACILTFISSCDTFADFISSCKYKQFTCLYQVHELMFSADMYKCT